MQCWQDTGPALRWQAIGSCTCRSDFDTMAAGRAQGLLFTVQDGNEHRSSRRQYEVTTASEPRRSRSFTGSMAEDGGRSSNKRATKVKILYRVNGRRRRQQQQESHEGQDPLQGQRPKTAAAEREPRRSTSFTGSKAEDGSSSSK